MPETQTLIPRKALMSTDRYLTGAMVWLCPNCNGVHPMNSEPNNRMGWMAGQGGLAHSCGKNPALGTHQKATPYIPCLAAVDMEALCQSPLLRKLIDDATLEHQTSAPSPASTPGVDLGPSGATRSSRKKKKKAVRRGPATTTRTGSSPGQPTS